MPIFLSLLMVLAISHISFAKPLILATIHTPPMVESSEKGLFIKLTKEILKRNKHEARILVLPTGKTLLAFSNQKVDGFFPALDADTPVMSAKTIPFYQKVDFIFYRKKQPLKDLKELEGKTVGLTFRYSYSRDLIGNRKIRFEYGPDDVTNMRKLASGKIDAFVAEERAGLKALELSNQREIEFDRTKPLSVQLVYYAFQNTAEGRKLAESFSKTLEAMKKDGSLRRILTEAAAAPP